MNFERLSGLFFVFELPCRFCRICRIFSAVSVFSEDLPISLRSIRRYIGLNILYSIKDILVMSNFSV